MFARYLIVATALLGTGMFAAEQDAGTPAVSDALSIHGGSNGTVWLVQMPGVGQELRLAARQQDAISRFRDELRAEIRRANTRSFSASDEQLASLRRQQQALAVDVNRRVVALLDAEQSRRLDQLYVRLLDRRALLEPRVASRLGITPAQQIRLRELVASDSKSDTVLSVLTPSQREQYERLRGAPFEFPRPQMILQRPQ
ncbi:MAG: hypothetical protein FJ276_15950 [Planctomycetes bacterium]|nr:hypothetical protein [Planctomycetota bacterium]